MNKHTPGPWASYPCNLEKYSQVITAKGCMVRIAYTGLDHNEVAMTKSVWGDRMTYGPGEETTANARLIVAAPLMLEALQAIAAECDAFRQKHQITGEMSAGIIASLAAIAAATGEKL